MKGAVLVIGVVILVVIVGGIYLLLNTNKTSECDRLAESFDEKVFGDNVGYEGIVGGTLLNVSELYNYYSEDEAQNKTTYLLTFKGAEKQGNLYLRTYSNKSFAYTIGNFYKIDLSNIRTSGYHTGSFFDYDMNKLQAINCS